MSGTHTSEPVVVCPHCQSPVLIEQVNCAIFRHGTHKNSGDQMDPHAPKSECDRLVREDAIYGCGRPFQIHAGPSGEWIAVECDYI